MPRGIYERKPRASSFPLKSKLHCKKCNYVWRYEGISSSTKCPICGTKKDARDKKEYNIDYIKVHPERIQKLITWSSVHKDAHREKTRMDTKKKVLAIISKSANPFCVSCGCDDMRLLEVNHKNGGGGKEMGKGIANKSMTFYRDITMLRRKTDDLEVLCRVCNAKHYLELKYGKLPIKVTWEGDNGL
jgi:hypothetical protein